MSWLLVVNVSLPSFDYQEIESPGDFLKTTRECSYEYDTSTHTCGSLGGTLLQEYIYTGMPTATRYAYLLRPTRTSTHEYQKHKNTKIPLTYIETEDQPQMEGGRPLAQSPSRPPLAGQLQLLVVLVVLLLPPRGPLPFVRPASVASSVENSRAVPVFAKQHWLVQPGLGQVAALLASRKNGRRARGKCHRDRKFLPRGRVDDGYRRGRGSARAGAVVFVVCGGYRPPRRVDEPAHAAVTPPQEVLLLLLPAGAWRGIKVSEVNRGVGGVGAALVQLLLMMILLLLQLLRLLAVELLLHWNAWVRSL